ncbi:glycosyltransferase family 2 protein [Jeotgalibaca sp. A122]|uniref:glycosyltransferase family 2 protein n=1 Tax=Jeotgalibaca sp. A122 TaxID=3457322 RepID=UPI003FD27837
MNKKEEELLIMNRVQVLLSTYNGENYLTEQLNSLLNQKNVEVDILVRDDGSNDSTKALLQEWQENKRLRWYTGENLRPKKSFLDLLKKSSSEFSYYAFCDQDDYWVEEKLLTAVNKIEQVKEDIPVLYFSEALLVDEELNELGKSDFATGAFSFEEILIKNNGSGCTMVFNKKLRDLINTGNYDNLSNEPLHDHWIYMVCLAAGGKVIYDSDSYIQYRQHGNNAVGGERSLTEKIKSSPLFNNEQRRFKWSMELLDNYKDFLTPDSHELLEKIKNYNHNFSSRYKLATDSRLRVDSTLEDAILKLTILFGKF